MIITIVCRPHETLLINDRTFKTNEVGMLQIDTFEIAVSDDRGPQEYDRMLDDYLSKEQKLCLYDMFLTSRKFGPTDTATVLGTERDVAKTVLDLGFAQSVLRKVDSQKGIRPEVRDTVRGLINTLRRVSVEPQVDVSRVELSKEVVQNETPVVPMEVATKRVLKKPLHIPKKEKGKTK